jgi:hypothetical protein
MTNQWNKKKVVDRYPDKTEIKGGHKDANRILESKGLKPIYSDEDEIHHQVSGSK